MKQFMNKRLHQKKKTKKKTTVIIIMPGLTLTILMRQFESTVEY